MTCRADALIEGGQTPVEKCVIFKKINFLWQVVLTLQAAINSQNLANVKLWSNVERLLQVLAVDPFQNPPLYEKLVGNLAGYYSCRINIQHQLVYQVLKDINAVEVLRMWSHYEL